MTSRHANPRQEHAFDSHPRSFSPAATYQQLVDRLTLPVLATGIALIATLLLDLSRNAAIPRRARSLALLLWDCIVYLTPTFLIHTLDSWMHPPLFPGLAPNPPPATHAEKSEKMAALLGVHKAASLFRSLSTSLPRPSFPAGAGFLGRVGSGDQPPGLGNLDNSCYQNSILQGLASLDHLEPYLSRALRPDPNDDETDVRLTRSLRDLVGELRDARNNGRTLWTPRALKNMCSFVQQDAQEYYSKLLDEIDREITRAASATTQNTRTDSKRTSTDSGRSDSTPVSEASSDSGYSSSSSAATSKLVAPRVPRSPLEGLLAQRVACVACGHTDGLSLIPFNCLTLNLGMNTPAHDLYERLDAYTRLEAIEGVECPRCTLLRLQRLLRALQGRFLETKAEEGQVRALEARLALVDEAIEDESFDEETVREKCKVSPESRVNVVKTKQAVIARPPSSLVVHMNRSVFDERTGMLFKNPAAVEFPTILDLGPWCLGSRAGPATPRTQPGVPADGEESDGVDAEGEKSAEEEERWILDPKVSMVAGGRGESLVSGPMYELRAVITHYGHHNNGHYICYRKHAAPPPEAPGVANEKVEEESALRLEDVDDVADAEDAQMSGPPEGSGDVAVDGEGAGGESRGEVEGEEQDDEKTWWRLSDESVYKVDEDMVTAQGGVFMLFYDCTDSTIIRTDEELFTLAKESMAQPLPLGQQQDQAQRQEPLKTGSGERKVEGEECSTEEGDYARPSSPVSTTASSYGSSSFISLESTTDAGSESEESLPTPTADAPAQGGIHPFFAAGESGKEDPTTVPPEEEGECLGIDRETVVLPVG